MAYAQIENIACDMYIYTQINSWGVYRYKYHLYLIGHNTFIFCLFFKNEYENL